MTDRQANQVLPSKDSSNIPKVQNEEGKNGESSEDLATNKQIKGHEKFDHSDLDSTKLELHGANKNSFVWINKIL